MTQLSSTALERAGALRQKLWSRASEEPGRVFDDIYNLIYSQHVVGVAVDETLRGPGGSTPGVDGETAEDFVAATGRQELVDSVISELKWKKVDFAPLKKIVITKEDGGRRQLEVPTVRDRVKLRAVKFVLEPILEADMSNYSFGFRPGLGPTPALETVAYFMRRGPDTTWSFVADIKNCFPSIPIAKVLRRLRGRVGDRRLLALLGRHLFSSGQEKKPSRGLPQGSPLSPLLLNFYLSDIDHQINVPDDVVLVRYADNLLVLAAGGEDHARRVLEQATAALQELGLRLHQIKLGPVQEGAEFLGHLLRRDGADVTMTPAPKSMTRFVEKLREKTDRLMGIEALQEVERTARGWRPYFDRGDEAHRMITDVLNAFTNKMLLEIGTDGSLGATCTEPSLDNNNNLQNKTERPTMVPDDARTSVGDIGRSATPYAHHLRLGAGTRRHALGSPPPGRTPQETNTMSTNPTTWLDTFELEDDVPERPVFAQPDLSKIDVSRATADDFLLQQRAARAWADYTGNVNALIKGRLHEVRTLRDRRAAQVRTELRREVPPPAKQVITDAVLLDDVMTALADEETRLVKAAQQTDALHEKMERTLTILSRNVELRRQEMYLSTGAR